MKSTLLLAAGLGLALALPSAASANTMTGPGPGPMYQHMQRGNSGPPAAARELYNTLRRAGFSNIHIAPHSFMVHAMNSNGHPVEVVVSPHSVAVATLDPQGSGNDGGSSQGNGMAGGNYGGSWQGHGMRGNGGGHWQGRGMNAGTPG